MKLFIKKLHKDAVVPTFAHHNDAGMDLCAVEETVIPPRERRSVATGLAMHIPDGHVGLIWDKSGLSQKSGLKTLGGVIDAGYRGEIFIGIYNTSDSPFTFSPGQKVAQILIQKVEQPEIEIVDDLDDSARGTGAFGSTGA